MEPMAATLDLIQKATDQCTHQMNTFIAGSSSNKTLQIELHQCTQHLQQLTLDLEAFKSPQQNSMKQMLPCKQFSPHLLMWRKLQW